VYDTTYERDWTVAMSRFWHVVALSAEVAPGGVLPVKLLGRELALWRSIDGELGLINDRCPHRGVALSLGTVAEDGCLTCPYHSWTFDRSGACTLVPQLDGRVLPGAVVPAASVKEAHGFVWACLSSEPIRDIPAFPELDAGTHWFWTGATFDWKAQNLRQVENFCDVSHFSVLHVDTFGNPGGIPLEPTTATRDGWSLRYTFDYPVMDPTAPPGPDRPSFPGVFDYHIELPCTVLLGGASGPASVMFIHSSPLDVYTTRLFWGTAFVKGVDIDTVEYADIEDRIWNPDRAIVESQRPRGLPVDVTPELHLPHDRCSVAFRRALADLGIPAPQREQVIAIP
jgi:vanillate O-demethylase monooxygenase subunit